jgi:hypothetical protein
VPARGERGAGGCGAPRSHPGISVAAAPRRAADNGSRPRDGCARRGAAPDRGSARAPRRGTNGARGTRRARRVAVRHRGAPRLWRGAGSVARAVRCRGARRLGARRPHAAGCAACGAARRGATAGCERHRADAASIVRIAAVGHRSGARSRQRLHGRPDLVRRSGRDRRIGTQAVPSTRQWRRAWSHGSSSWRC